MSVKLQLMHAANRKIKNQSEEVFEGISRGRKKALDNWFKDVWVQIENTSNIIKNIDEKELKFSDELNDKLTQYENFCEFLILDSSGTIINSTYKGHVGNDMSNFPNFQKGMKNERYMYGPYKDKNTLDIDLSKKKFSDEVTLLFSIPYVNFLDEKRIFIGRVLNDDMSNVIQDEDTHVYKDSGDNYLFMIKNNRGILPGTAISRSRFEDNTFTKGDNLKDGVKTAKWGMVKIKKHTEFEIRFTDPETNELHIGVKNTIKNGQNLDAWPGYPDYRHIMVGGKGIIINPPYSDETWFIITIVSYLVCQKLVVKPLNRTVDMLHILAEGEGDLTKRVDKLSYDEIGELSRWFNKFINNQMTMIKRVDTSSKTSINSIKMVSNLTNMIKDSMEIVAKTVNSLVEVSKSQNDAFQGTKEHFNELSAAIQETGSLVNEVTEKVVKTSNHAFKANDSSNNVLNTISDLEKSMKLSLEKITLLQKHSESITKVVTTIKSISNQIQMLALNASIEAARAGESGKGFGVVAEEISKLAAETDEATKSIGELISNVQKETNNTFNEISSIDSKVSDSTSSVKDTINSFKYITDNIKDINENMDTILFITNKESDYVNNMVVSINESADKINKRTAKDASKSEESLVLLQNILNDTKKLKHITDDLEYSSNDLQNMVGAFKVM